MKIKPVLDEKGMTVGVEIAPESGNDGLWLRDVKSVSLYMPYRPCSIPAAGSLFLLLSTDGEKEHSEISLTDEQK
jgi:hypothetical protein